MIKTNSQRAILVTAITLLASAAPMLAEGCKAYPYQDGMDPDLIGQNKYVATASASVSFDDIDAVKDAREEATLEAKATLAKFLTEEIKSDSTIAKIVNESKTMSGAGKENVRNEAIKRTKLLRNSSQALLRGVITIGDCYTKGTEVRVTVGVKPETINAAEGLAGGIGASVANQPTAGSKSTSGVAGSSNVNGATSGTKQPLSNVDESNNTTNLKKF
jgi:hypothetical protein